MDPRYKKTWDHECRKNMTREQIAQRFTEEAHVYEEAILSSNYDEFVHVADAVAEIFTSVKPESVSVFDVAAGTGLLGQELLARGFKTIDWLDPSEGMELEAKKKDIYRNFFRNFMDGLKIPGIETDTYDCVAIAGALNIGLIPCAGFLEMIRIVKPGGVICFGFHPSRSDCKQYKNRLILLWDELEKDGFWKLHGKKDVDKFYDNSSPGSIYTYSVKSSELDSQKYITMLDSL